MIKKEEYLTGYSFFRSHTRKFYMPCNENYYKEEVMRKHRDKSKSPGTFKTGAYLVFIAVIAVKTLRAVMNVFVTTYDAVRAPRHTSPS